jgi:CTP synthase
LRKEKLDERVLEKLNINNYKEPNIDLWKEFLGRLKNPTNEVTIGLVGKYVELPDAYKSINEAFVHAGAQNECKVIVKTIHSEDIKPSNCEEMLGDLDGILIAPGFGERGIPGKIETARYARENDIPFFGICLGMQCAVIEFAMNVVGLKEAASTEVNPDTPDPVIDLMEEQKSITMKGGTMRLGAYKCRIEPGTQIHSIYQKTEISERHRHRYEYNNQYLDLFKERGMVFSGINPESDLVEIIELEDHPWFIGTQFHPELKSTVLNPHPLFVNFVAASLEHKKNKVENRKLINT